VTPREGRLALLLAAITVGACAAVAHAGVSVGRSGWQWGNPLPQGHGLRALDMDGSLGYAAGDFGTLLRTDDGGSTWTALSTGVTADLAQVAILDSDSVVVAGRCAVRRSDDGGRTFVRLAWTTSDERCGATIAAIAFPTEQRGYLVRTDGSILRTDDGGLTWTTATTLVAGEPTAAAFTSADVGVLTTASGLIYRTADGGGSWTIVRVESHGLRAVAFTGPTIGYVVGDDSTVLRTLDGGKTWSLRSTGDPRTLSSISCASPPVCLAVGDGVVLTTDGGKTLRPIAAPEDVLTIAFSTGARAVGVGSRGTIVTSDDDGGSWAPIGGRLAGTFIRLRATSAALAFATGPAGRLARTVDGGRTWQALGAPTREDITDVSFGGGTVGYALDLLGHAFRTTDGGASWHRLRPGFPARPQALLATRGVVLLVGPHGILRSANGGRTFARVRSRAARRAKLFEIDRAGRALFAFGSRRIAVSSNSGRTWRTVRRPRRALIAAVDFVTRRTGFLLEQDGRLWRTHNGGRRWHDLAGIGSDDGIGLAFSSTSTGYVTLSRFGDSAGGYVSRTTDGGRTWRPELLTDTPLAAAGVVAKGATALALAVDGSLFFNDSATADARSAVALSTTRRTLHRRRTIRLNGRVFGAQAGAEVLVARRFRGESGWDHRIVTVGSRGAFTSSWKMTRTATFVAQWIGDGDQAGDGSKPLRVRVRRRR
jgi:photosystem II stability/assembly factor-like uncharacterized protein